MKASIKLAVVSALALIGGVANAANVNTLSNSATGSSLVLMLKNYSDTEYVMFELSPTVNDVKSLAVARTDDPSFYSSDESGLPGSLTVPSVLNGYTNANLTSYLADSTNIGDNIVWTIMGSATGNGTAQLGQGVTVLTSTIDFMDFNHYWDNSAAYVSAQAMGTFILDELNAPGVTFANGVSTTNGWDSATGKFAPVSFNGGGFENGAALGTAQSLYAISTVGDEGYAANIYKSQYTLTLNSAGLLSYDAPVSAVPVPAAIWLLGSGLMGLVGIGRRRNAAAVVSA